MASGSSLFQFFVQNVKDEAVEAAAQVTIMFTKKGIAVMTRAAAKWLSRQNDDGSLNFGAIYGLVNEYEDALKSADGLSGHSMMGGLTGGSTHTLLERVGDHWVTGLKEVVKTTPITSRSSAEFVVEQSLFALRSIGVLVDGKPDGAIIVDPENEELLDALDDGELVRDSKGQFVYAADEGDVDEAIEADAELVVPTAPRPRTKPVPPSMAGTPTAQADVDIDLDQLDLSGLENIEPQAGAFMGPPSPSSDTFSMARMTMLEDAIDGLGAYYARYEILSLVRHLKVLMAASDAELTYLTSRIN